MSRAIDQPQKKVVTIGGNFAGLLTAKFFLKDSQASAANKFHFTLVSQSTHAFFNPAAARLLVEPDKIPKSVFSLESEFAKYDKSRSQLIHSKVTDVDLDAKVVTLDGSKKIDYDVLVVASGARAYSPAFKLSGQIEDTLGSLKSLNAQISSPDVESIAVIGGGPTGVETASELAAAYKDKKQIFLYTGSACPLPDQSEKVSLEAMRRLQALGVHVINGVRVDVPPSRFPSPVSSSSPSSKANLSLSNGTSHLADICIPTMGIRPNTSFLPKSVLDANGFVKTDRYFRLEGHPYTYAIGDVLSCVQQRSMANINMIQKNTLYATLRHDLIDPSTKLVPYDPAKPAVLAVPISKEGGVGSFFGWNMPSIMVRFMKGRDYMLGMARMMLNL